MILPREVEELIVRYRSHGGAWVRGAFVIGSAVLGDWWPGVSDVDLVALVESADAVHDGRLREIHERMRADPGPGAVSDLEVLYLEAADLAQAPARVGVRPHHRRGPADETSREHAAARRTPVVAFMRRIIDESAA